MGARDRAFVADGAFAYLRRKRSLETLAREHAAAPSCARDGRARLRASRCASSTPPSTRSDARWLAAFKVALHDPLPPAVAADVPDWLWDRLGDVYGDDARAALDASVADARAARPARQHA